MIEERVLSAVEEHVTHRRQEFVLHSWADCGDSCGNGRRYGVRLKRRLRPLASIAAVLSGDSGGDNADSRAMVVVLVRGLGDKFPPAAQVTSHLRSNELMIPALITDFSKTSVKGL